MKRVAVIGCGLMGSGIAEVCARAGLDVVVLERDDAAVQAGRELLDVSLSSGVRRARLTDEERSSALERLRFTTDISQLHDRELVIESASENQELKLRLFQQLDAVIESDDAILSSNTSTIPIIRLAKATNRPEAVVGLHFFNPVPLMALVEVIPSLLTSETTTERAGAFAADVLGKQVIVSKDQSGFIVNVLLVPYLLSAIRLFASGFATAEDIDKGMELGCAHPFGPLKVADFIGLDSLLAASGVLYDEFKDPMYLAPPLLSRMVDAGFLGRKSGRGFYTA